MHVNDQPVHDEPQMPFGGVKDSGWGRFGVATRMEEFTELRWITMKSRPAAVPLLGRVPGLDALRLARREEQ